MKWVFYQHKQLHDSLHEAVRSLTTVLFFLEIPYTSTLIIAIPILPLRYFLVGLWMVLGFTLFICYHIFTDTNVTRRTHFIVWTASAALNALIALGSIAMILLENVNYARSATFLLPVGYFGAKAVMSAYLAMRAWNYMEEAKMDRERAAALHEGALARAREEG